MLLRMVAKKIEWELVSSLLNLTKNLENFSKNTERTELAQHPHFWGKSPIDMKIWQYLEIMISIGPY